MCKSKKILKSIAVLLSLTLFISIIVGCAQKTKEEGGKETTKQESTKAEPEAKFPYNGSEVKFRIFWVTNDNWDENNLVMKEFQKKIGNIKLVWENPTWADYDTKLEAYLGSGDVPDIVVARSILKKIGQYGESGILLDWQKYINEGYMPIYKKLTEKYEFLNVTLGQDGKRFGLGTTANGISFEDELNEGWFYNETLLNKYGMAVPKTSDEMLDVMRQLKKKQDNILGYTSRWGIEYLVYALSTIFGKTEAQIEYDENTQKYYFGPLKQDSNLKRILEYAHTLYKEGLISPEIVTDNDERSIEKWKAGNWAFTYFYYGFYDESFKSKGITTDWVAKVMAPPTYNGKSYTHIGAFDGAPYWGILSSSKCQNPTLLAQFMDYCLTEEISTLFHWGIEGVTFKVNPDGTKAYLPDVQLSNNLDGKLTYKETGLGAARRWVWTIADVEANKTASYSTEAMESYKFYKNLVKTKKITPLYISANVFGSVSPPLSSSESDEVSKILTPIKTYVDESIVKFVIGQMNLSEWDKFVEQISKMGDINKVLEIYQSKPPKKIAPRD